MDYPKKFKNPKKPDPGYLIIGIIKLFLNLRWWYISDGGDHLPKIKMYVCTDVKLFPQ